MTKRPIAWEPHPVTPGRKAELLGAGFKLIDAAFAPPDEPLVRARLISADPAMPGLAVQISERDFNPELHAPEAGHVDEAERLRLAAETEAAQKAEAERLAALQQPEAAPAAEAPAAAQEAAPAPAPAATPARKRARSTTPTTEA
jgi:hypothetical protein